MYSSIYNDKRIDTKKFFYKNLISSYHFSSTVRTPPNEYRNNFVGELKKHIKPKFDFSTIFINKKSRIYSINCKSENSPKRKIFPKKNSLPKLLINNNMINNSINFKKKKYILTTDGIHIGNPGVGIGIVDLNFPYCKPKLKCSHTNLNIRYKCKNLTSNKNDLVNLKKSERLFIKSLTNIHQMLNKIKDDNDKKICN